MNPEFTVLFLKWRNDFGKTHFMRTLDSLLLAVLLPGILFPQNSHFYSSGKNGKA